MRNNKNKSGYELRQELLGMAVGIVAARSSREWEAEHLKPEGTRRLVPSYTTEEIIAEAEKLYAFVQTK